MFINTVSGELCKKSYERFHEPVEPFKRDFTKEERLKLFHHFQNHSFSKIDANGHIILGGGEESAGKFYITEEDLKQLP